MTNGSVVIQWAANSSGDFIMRHRASLSSSDPKCSKTSTMRGTKRTFSQIVGYQLLIKSLDPRQPSYRENRSFLGKLFTEYWLKRDQRSNENIMHRQRQDGSGGASSQQVDLRFSGPPLGQGAGGGARTRDRGCPADLRVSSLVTAQLTHLTSYFRRSNPTPAPYPQGSKSR
ncbi:hypothetical protein PoB_007579100 [Plakobranchus ocellatus]|uniref:Uncharacterized protein n=1 Tax=Plakobranchus ocellatus TaxID=259542 RepID=A0AAV4DZM2_9GAST|nr:hypothetical protein PoB_007579100 [Plakobranchus ocellatus]